MASDKDSLTTQVPASPAELAAAFAPTATPGKEMLSAQEVDVPGRPDVDVDSSHALLERLLAMAHEYRSDGKLHEAMELYWGMVEDHPGTSEAKASSDILLAMAAGFERNDEPRMARSIYERLLTDQAD